MKTFDCDICGQEMKLDKDFGKKPRGPKKAVPGPPIWLRIV
jgi:hypothetical protein